jgi:hypothetical protein
MAAINGDAGVVRRMTWVLLAMVAALVLAGAATGHHPH